MARARFWNLRLNLDEFNAALAALDDDQQRSDFLLGLSRGMNGGQLRLGADEALSMGFELGQGMRHEAEEYRAGRSVNGKRGGRPKGNHMETTAKPHGTHMGNQSGTQSTILLKNPVHEDATSVGTRTGSPHLEEDDIPFGEGR
jgi:hypothetical protein